MKILKYSHLAYLFPLALLALAVGSARAATFTKANTTTMNTTADWSSGWTSPGTSADIDTWTSSTISLQNAMNMKLGANLTCATLNFNTSSGSPAATAEVINADGSSLDLYTSILNANGNYTPLSTVINCPIVLHGTGSFGGGTGKGDMTFAGSISEASAGQKVTIVGQDAWINFSAANSYSGVTAVNAQCLLTLSGSGTIGNGSGGLTMGAGGAFAWLDLGGTTQNVGAVAFGNSLIQNGTLNATTFSGSGVVSADLGNNGATAATLSPANNTTLVLSGTLGYTGTTTIGNGATLISTKPLPSGNISLGSATSALVARVGGAGEWASTDIDSLLARTSTALAITAGAALGFDTSDGNFTYANAITGPTPANLGLLKRGENTLTLTGASTYQKATTINRGTLLVDNTAGGSLSSSSPLTFTGTGTFNYNTASTAQSLAALTLSGGEGTVSLTRSSAATLTFASLAARPAGNTANLTFNGGTPSATDGIKFTTAAAGFMNQGVFYNGADYAYMDAANTFVRAPVYGTDAGFAAADTITANAHNLLTATPAAQSSITLNTLKLAGSGVGFPLNTSSDVLTLANGGILKTGGGTAGTISGGTVLTTDSLHDLVVRTDSSGDALDISSTLGFTGSLTATASASNVLPDSNTTGLYVGMSVLVTTGGGATFTGVGTISAISANASITLSMTSGSVVSGTSYTVTFYGNSLTKSGAGTLTLSGANNLVNVNLNAGQLNINNAAALGGGVPSTFTGASQNNPIGKFTINEGTTIDNTSGNPITMTYKYNLALNGSFTFVGSNDLTFINANGNGNLSIPNDLTITTSTKDKTLSIFPSMSAVTTAKLTKNGPGTLLIGRNTSSFINGGVVINEGVFGNPYGTQPDSTYSGLLTLGDATPGNSHAAILYLNSSPSHGAPINVRAGSSGPLAIYADYNVTYPNATIAGPTLLNNTLTLAAASKANIYYNGVISGTGGLAIGDAASTAFTVAAVAKTLANAGTVALYNRNTYTGNTVINSGTLKLGALGTINNSALLSIAAGATLDVSGTTNYVLSSSTAFSASGTGTAAATAAQIIAPSGGEVSLGAQPITLAWTGATSGTDTAHPCLYVSQGALTLNNNTFTINGAANLGIGTYRLIQVGNGTSGTLNENASPSYTVTGTAIDGTKSNVISSDGSGNLILTVSAALTPAIAAGSPLPGSLATTYGTASSAQSESVSGSSLTADITATAQAGFEVSSDGATWGGTATFPQTSGSASGTLYVRLAATKSGGACNNTTAVVLSSDSATSVNVATTASGNAVNPAPGSFTISTVKNQAATFSASKIINHASDAGVTLSVTAVSSASAQGGTVTLATDNATYTNITYTPATDFAGADSFTYTLSDNAGGSSVGMVNVTVNSVNAGPTITATVDGGGYGTFTASGLPGTNYVIQIATNLSPANWTDYATATAAANGLISFTDSVTVAGHGGQVYYRLRQQ